MVGGSRGSEGRVEVYSDGLWGTICYDDSWDLNDASVVCRELGFGRAVQAWSSAAFGHIRGLTMMNDVDCVGNEKTVFECQYNGLGIYYCWHGEDAGVQCGK